MADRDFMLGQHDADIKTLLEITRATAQDVSSIKATLAERNGERRALMRAGALAGAGVSLLFTFIGWVVKEFIKQ